MNDLDQFKDTYITECFELLEEMEAKLLEVSTCDDVVDTLNAIFRCAHSIKGGAGAFGFTKLVEFTHILEFLLDAMREEQIDATEDVVDALLQSVDIVAQMVTCAHEGEDPPEGFGNELAETLKKMCASVSDSSEASIVVEKEENKPVLLEETIFYNIKFVAHKTLFASGNEPLLIIRELKRVGDVSVKINSDKVPEIADIDVEECYLSWEFEVTSDKGLDVINEVFEFVEDECDLEIEEFGAISLPAAEEEKDLSEEDEFGGVFTGALESLNDEDAGGDKATEAPAQKDNGKEKELKKPPAVSSIRVDIDKIDALVNMAGEMVITQAMVVQQTQSLPPDQFGTLIMSVEDLSRHMRELQEAVMAVRMQPVKSVFARMPRIVRDLSRTLGKDIVIEMHGENTEIDKTVIEQLSDPLTHMIRNSVDHGITAPDDRRAKGKPEQGTIILTADNRGGRIIIEVEDDGEGINREKVLAKAIEKGLASEDTSLTDEEIDNLIFRAGFSTADAVTDVSGRGVGMDVVRSNITALGGVITLKNSPGKGSKFTVSLPLTLAILDGMIVRAGEELYIIPINNIIESLSPNSDQIEKVPDAPDVLNVRGEFVPILYLHEVFNIKRAKAEKAEEGKNNKRILVMLVESGNEKFGVVVDDIVRQQQVVIKSLEENSDPVEGVSGATILGDGNVSLILDLAALHKMISSQTEVSLRAA